MLALVGSVSSASAARPRARAHDAPTLGPSNQVVAGPDAGIVGLSGMSVARDGTGGLVYLDDVGGVARVFVSRLLGGSFQAPQQVDTGLPGASSQPVIAADNGGVLLVAFINAGQLYVAQATNALTAVSAPALLYAGAANPSLSMSTFGKAYLAFTALGAGQDDVRAAYYYAGQWALDPAPLDASPADDAGDGTGRPAVATSGDGVGIVVWGENGHIYSRRVVGTTSSAVYEQADPATFDGLPEVSAQNPTISTGGDSSYASVAFQETFANGAARQSRVLDAHLHGSRYDDVVGADGGVVGGEGADQPQTQVTEFGAGWVTSERQQSHQLVAESLGDNASYHAVLRVDSLPNAAAPDAVPANAGLYSTLIAWQQSPGVAAPAEIRIRYASNVSNLGPETVVSSPALGATDAGAGLAAGGDQNGDAVVAWVQGTGAATQIVSARLYQPPGGFAPGRAFGYARTPVPLLSWSTAAESWGAIRYTVAIDGRPVAATYATRIRAPAALTQGRHIFQVTATNGAGLTSGARAATVFVDTVPPGVRVRLTGRRIAGDRQRIAVTYTDSSPSVPGGVASGVASAQIRWGDGGRATLTHGNRASVTRVRTHVFKRRRTYTVRVTVVDRAGNRTVVVRKLTIRPKPMPRRHSKTTPGKHRSPAKGPRR